jgi:soluble lytic murein transglycosylase
MPLTAPFQPAGTASSSRVAPRLALLLGLLATPAAAQPWAGEAQRSAGRAALAMANGGRYAAAEAAAVQADPLVRKIALWLRLSARGQGTGQELAEWMAANPDWPLPKTLAIRTEEALAADPDDARALAYFARNPATTLDGAQRHADALARASDQTRAATILREASAAASPKPPPRPASPSAMPPS